MKRPFPPAQNRGVALVIVLSFLVLMTVFAVAFFTSVTADSQGSTAYAKNVVTQQLAQSAVSMAMGQIKAATTQNSGVTWVSQPGLIRTFDAKGNPLNSYRLFSTSNMKLPGSANPDSEAVVIQRKEWSEYTAHMVDLNRPAPDANGELVYPILDPRAETDEENQIQGFSFDPSRMGDKFITPTSPAPMPVRWLYVLANGNIVTGRETNKTTATFENASKDNPVVGRIAFWTDDESSKVNINTAAGDEWEPSNTSYGPAAGSYWDVPRTYSLFDRQALANYQPAQGEFQRYPGHPATTYLSAVFPSLTSAQIGTIVSRVQRGGSLGGTTVAAGRVVPDADRLYASIDELLFSPDRAEQPITKERLELGRFFLTAHSRAPEVNLFNMPRVAIWPIHRVDSNSTRTAYDRLIAFCATIRRGSGPNAPKDQYFFDRANADSPTADYVGRNVQLYQYLQKLTDREIPGFGGKFSTKYGTANRDQILTQILDYVRSTNLFDDTLEPIPGVYPTTGQQFTNRRTSQTGVEAGHGQVTPLKINAGSAQTMGFGRFYTVSEVGLHFICTADAAHPASNTTANRTLLMPLSGKRRRIEAMLQLELFSPSQGWTGLVPDMQIRVRGLNTFRINGTSLGFPADASMQIARSGTSTFHGRAWGGPAGFRFLLYGRKLPARGFMTADSGLNAGNSYPFISIPITVDVPDTGTPTMRFNGGTLTIDVHSGATATLSAANHVQTLLVNLPEGDFPIPSLVTTGTAAMPASPESHASATAMQNWWSFSAMGAVNGFPGRLNGVYRHPGQDGQPWEGAFIRAEDVIRTVVPYHGDYRLVAARQTVPTSMFVKHRYYDTVNRNLAHSFSEAVGLKYIQGSDTSGTLVTGAAYGWGQYPDIPHESVMDNNSRIRVSRGDWDTGMTTVQDGAYINKPDEGNNFRGSGGQIPYFDNNQNQEGAGETFFSPNRQIPSPVVFGSLPTGMFTEPAGRSWQTLLFRPDTNASTSGTHVGTTATKDHLLLDLFWMPVVEPYAISEPFSTAGKVNMNTQIAPFTYFKRTTAIRALLKSERVTAIPTADAGIYKTGSSAKNYRHAIDADETLKQFESRFAANRPFRSATEICELYLVPEGRTLANMQAFWNTHRLTGDNLKERPYATLYPRLTTKSNVYTVHVYVQTLKQVNRTNPNDWKVWDENRDVVTGEYRGSTVVERYVDLEDPTLPDFATLPVGSTQTLDSYTKLRVIMNRKFAP